MSFACYPSTTHYNYTEYGSMECNAMQCIALSFTSKTIVHFNQANGDDRAFY